MRTALSLLFVTALVTPLLAQDASFLATLERAQRDRPSTLSSTGRIAPAAEPGTPLVIHGTVVAEDGRAPVADAVVFAYQTDREGLYHRQGESGWRLRGWTKTDAQGRFVFETIRPGEYPSRTIPAHVHFIVYAGDDRYSDMELRFEDDPLLSASERDRSTRDGEFGGVRPVRREGRTQHVDFRMRLDPRRRF